MKSKKLAGIVALAILASWSSLAARAENAKIQIQWLGQSATKITTQGGKVIVIDPFLTKNPKTPEQYKNLDALGKVDLILVTHAHGDHLGEWAGARQEEQGAALGNRPDSISRWSRWVSCRRNSRRE